MKYQVQEIRGQRGSKEGQDLRNLLNVVLAFPKESRLYWIGAMVKQGVINEGIAGRLIMKGGV